MSLFLKWINFRIGPTHHLNIIGFQLHLLAFSRGIRQGAVGNDGTTGLQFQNIAPVIGQVLVRNNLQTGKGGTIVYFNK